MASSVVPVRMRGGVVALESSFQGGVKREKLRSLCQLVNDTQLRLEVALVGDPSRSRSSSASSSRGFGRQESLVWPFSATARLLPLLSRTCPPAILNVWAALLKCEILRQFICP